MGKLNSKELMIGDYLMAHGMPYRVIQIDGIVRDGWMLENGEEDCGEPIPITSDILEKNEIDSVFKTRYKGFYLEYHSEAGMIMLYVYNNGSFQPTGISFKYVHELQNALRILGITKQIEI